MEPASLPSAFQYFSNRYGGLVEVGDSNVATALAVGPLVAADSDRVNLLLVNNGANIVRIAINPTLLPAAGIELPAAGGRIELNVDQHGALVTAPLSCASLVGASAVYIVATKRTR